MLTGAGKIRILVLGIGIVVAALLPFRTSQAGSVQPLPAVSGTDGRLGLDDVLPGSPAGSTATWASLASAAGARVNRWEFRWDRIEPHRGVWDFSKDDPAVADSQQAGLDVLGILIGTPAWATAPGQRPGNGLPRGLYRAVDDSRNLWADYVRETVTHYTGLVRWWEIWNEPDLQFFWNGTARDYFRLLKVSYLVIHATDPAAKVMMAGMVVPDLAFMRSVLQADSRDSGSRSRGGYLDIAAWHAYGASRVLYDNLQHLRALLDGFGLTVPIWVTEAGFPASNPNGALRQAAYVLQDALYAFAAGANRLLVYRASDDSTPKQWGLLNAQGGPRPSYVAFQVAAQYLSHARAVVYSPTPGVERFTIYRPNQRVAVVWNHGTIDRTVDLDAAQSTATLVDWSGRSTAATIAGGKVRFTAPGAIYNVGVDPAGTVVGGPPVLEVEDNSAPGAEPLLSYIPSMSGSHRKLVLFNPGTAPATAVVAAADATSERVVEQIAPGGLRVLDLDLMAGDGYGGSYTVSASAPLSQEAVSDSTALGAATPSTQWLIPAAPTSMMVTDASVTAATVSMVTHSSTGTMLAQTQVHVAAGGTASWTLPAAARAGRATVTVQSNQPVALLGTGGPQAAAQAAQTLWYAVRPQGNRLAIFNPGDASSVVNVQLVGSSSVTSEQLNLGSGHARTVSTQSAKAVVVSSTLGVAVTYASGPLTQIVPSAATAQSALTAAGATTMVDLFNPSAQPAHVTVSFVRAAGSAQTSLDLPPLHVRSVRVRTPNGAPGGVLVESDTPVVATAR